MMLSDSLSQIRTTDTRRAGKWRFQINLADFQDRFGVDLGIAAQPHDFLVACAFPFFDQARADPPHQRMKPEGSFHQHVNRGSEVIAATHVA